jgi:hypothetical protein
MRFGCCWLDETDVKLTALYSFICVDIGCFICQGSLIGSTFNIGYLWVKNRGRNDSLQVPT